MAEWNAPVSALLLFEIAGENCAIPAGRVAEIVPIPALARFPGSPSVLEGVLNLRGTAVPVIRLDRLFGRQPSHPGLYAHVVVLRDTNPRSALLVDRVLDVVAPLPDAYRPVAEQNSFNDCAVAEVEVAGRAVHVLSPDRLLLNKERQVIVEFEALGRQYLADLERGDG
ncbi:MAG TPA: chemotaxis protein CheW [Bryobacteraceae bacterium]|nr:chemotaxis protein CheW [Bryobacteraceae bacterium]